MPTFRPLSAKAGFFVVLAASLLLAGCGTAAQAPAGGQPQAKEEQPQYGGTLIFGVQSASRCLDPFDDACSASRTAEWIYENLVGDDLFDRNWREGSPEFKQIPALAERWEIAPEGLSYTFYLRKGVKWQDGKDFTAADVLYTYQRLIDTKGSQANNLRNVTKMEAPDANTVKLTTKEPDADFLAGLNRLYIVAKHVGETGADLRSSVIGTGPFKLQSFDNKSKSVLIKNESYWEQGQPYIDRVEQINTLDKSALVAALAARQVDSSWGLTPTELQTVQKAAPDVQVIEEPLISNTDLYFNIRHPILKDPRVRRALHVALDRQALVKLGISQGKGFVSCFLPGGLGWCLPNLEQLPGFRQPKAQDIAEAKQLLAEAGYPNGFEFSFLFSTNQTQSGTLAELFATQMTPLGIKVKLDPRDNASWSDSLRRGTNDATMAVITGPRGTSFYDYYHTKGPSNVHGMSDAGLDRLLEQQARTFDPAERKKIWFDIQRKLLELNWSIPFIDPMVYGVLQPWVKGPTVLNKKWNTMASTVRVSTTWLDQKLMPKR